MDAANRLAWLGRQIRKRKLTPEREPPRAIRYGRHLPRSAPATPAARAALRLEDAVDGDVTEVEGVGRALVLTHRETIETPVDPGHLFFDIEATGLTAAPLFLIGVMSATGEEGGREVTVRQFLARHYAEEAAVVSLFVQAAEPRTSLVSFNGKSYDLPFIRTRAALHRIPCDVDLDHVDLLHVSRRRWKDELPDCRLQTLETRILGKPRVPDIPGADIPDAYHAFVRSGDASDIVRILTHNVRDLVSLAELLARLESGAEATS